MDYEEIIMRLIVTAGTSRNHGMNAIAQAHEGQMEETLKLIASAREEATNAHHYQTELIQKEATGENFEITLLTVHAQDHLMNAMTVIDLAEEFVKLYQDNRRTSHD